MFELSHPCGINPGNVPFRGCKVAAMKEDVELQGPQGDEALRGLDAYEQMVNTFVEQAKGYWGLWGPTGETMHLRVEYWAQMQQAYIQWLRQVYEVRNRP